MKLAVWLIFVAAAMLEVGGDVVVRRRADSGAEEEKVTSGNHTQVCVAPPYSSRFVVVGIGPASSASLPSLYVFARF
jgi:hypothetical protein